MIDGDDGFEGAEQGSKSWSRRLDQSI